MKTAAPKISNDEKRWRAEDDARIMKRYHEVIGDKSRVAAAKNIIKAEVKQSQKVLGKKGV